LCFFLGGLFVLGGVFIVFAGSFGVGLVFFFFFFFLLCGGVFAWGRGGGFCGGCFGLGAGCFGVFFFVLFFLVIFGGGVRCFRLGFLFLFFWVGGGFFFFWGGPWPAGGGFFLGWGGCGSFFFRWDSLRHRPAMRGENALHGECGGSAGAQVAKIEKAKKKAFGQGEGTQDPEEGHLLQSVEKKQRKAAASNATVSAAERVERAKEKNVRVRAGHVKTRRESGDPSPAKQLSAGENALRQGGRGKARLPHF